MQNFMKNKSTKKKEGITLIALVITVIVLLILAAISIIMLTGDNNILKRAVDAKERTERATIIETAKTDILGQVAENKEKSISKKQLIDILNKQFKTVDEKSLPDEISSKSDIKLTTLDERYTINLSEIYIGKFAKNNENEITVVEGNPAEWETNTEGDKLVKYLGLNENVIFPNTLNGKKITTIGPNVLQGKTDIVKTIEISNGFTNIEDSAFQGCSNLTGNLLLPDSITTIGSKAFLGCVGFNGELYIGKNVTSIYSCKNPSTSSFGGTGNTQGWKKITINMKDIPDEFMPNGSGVKANELIIGNNTEKIGKKAFMGNTNLLGNLTIGNNVLEIGDMAFSDCRGLEGDLIIPDSVYTLGTASFNNCSGFTGDLTLGKNVKSILEATFTNCLNFTKIVIPDTIENISFNAFQNVDKSKIVNNSSSEGYPWGAK